MRPHAPNTWAPLVLLLAIGVGAAGACFSELNSDACVDDVECFDGERCVEGRCLPSATVTDNNDVPDAGMDAEEDVVEVPDTDMEDEEPIDQGSGRVNGTVVRASDFTPIANALVRTFPPTDQVLTNDQGEFLLENRVFLQDPHDLSVTRVGFQEYSQDIIFEGGGARDIDIVLCHEEEIVCNGEDDDCDGTADEGVINACGGCAELGPDLGDPCSQTCGEVWSCDGEDALRCESVDVEICDNGADDDCDNDVDEADCQSPGGG